MWFPSCEPGRSSLWTLRHRRAQAAYPGLRGSEQLPVQKRTSSLLGLAPNSGCLAADIAAGAGGPLHHLFTLTQRGWAVIFCGPCSGSPQTGNYPALCSVERGLSSSSLSCSRSPGRHHNHLNLTAKRDPGQCSAAQRSCDFGQDTHT